MPWVVITCPSWLKRAKVSTHVVPNCWPNSVGLFPHQIMDIDLIAPSWSFAPRVFHPPHNRDYHTSGPYSGMSFDDIERIHHRGIQFGADGRITRDGDKVWVLATYRSPGFLGMVDYFHGCKCETGSPISQLDMIPPGRREEVGVCSADMIPVCPEGGAVRAVVVLQQRFRAIKGANRWRWIGLHWKLYNGSLNVLEPGPPMFQWTVDST